MNKREAKIRSREGKLSIGDLRKMIAEARLRGGPSKVNPQFTLAETCNIFEAALADRDDAEIPVGMRGDPYRNGRTIPTRDSLTIYNILRDCAA